MIILTSFGLMFYYIRLRENQTKKEVLDKESNMEKIKSETTKDNLEIAKLQLEYVKITEDIMKKTDGQVPTMPLSKAALDTLAEIAKQNKGEKE